MIISIYEKLIAYLYENQPQLYAGEKYIFLDKLSIYVH